jgi:HSP20 family protein
MSLIRYEPYSLLDRLQKDFFGATPWDRYTRDGTDDTYSTISQWHPAVDIKEEQDKYLIHADLPGVEAKDIDITVENGVLTLKGNRSSESTEERNGYKRVERMQGTFYRRFTLPDSVDADKVEARSRNGVLEIIVPKHEKVQPRRITVNN